MSDNISKEEKESIRLSMLNVFSNEPVKHKNKSGEIYYSGTRNNNPDCLKNRVAQSMEP
jgi:hypothetical protein